LETVELPVSSSDIRATIAHGVMPPELSGDVWNYIQQHHLYV
jgi:nicotinic acid mononucleotide adenylyltransferase